MLSRGTPAAGRCGSHRRPRGLCEGPSLRAGPIRGGSGVNTESVFSQLPWEPKRCSVFLPRGIWPMRRAEPRSPSGHGAVVHYTDIIATSTDLPLRGSPFTAGPTLSKPF